MNPIIWTIAGFVVLTSAIALVHSVKDTTLGPNTSRILAALIALWGYYYILKSIPFVKINPVRYSAVSWIVPIGFAGFIVYYGYQIYRNPDPEIDGIKEKAPRILAAALLCALARFLYAL